MFKWFICCNYKIFHVSAYFLFCSVFMLVIIGVMNVIGSFKLCKHTDPYLNKCFYSFYFVIPCTCSLFTLMSSDKRTKSLIFCYQENCRHWHVSTPIVDFIALTRDLVIYVCNWWCMNVKNNHLQYLSTE